MKLILGIIAFILTFGFSTTLVGLLFGFPQETVKPKVHQLRTNHAVKHKIRSLLRRDVRNGRSRHRAASQLYRSEITAESLYSNPAYRFTVLTYVRKSASMNDAGLPRDFQYAWRNHMKAWKKQAMFIEAIEKNLNNPNSFSIRAGDNTNEINQTWSQVLRIAERYGLNIDNRYYR